MYSDYKILQSIIILDIIKDPVWTIMLCAPLLLLWFAPLNESSHVICNVKQVLIVLRLFRSIVVADFWNKISWTRAHISKYNFAMSVNIYGSFLESKSDGCLCSLSSEIWAKTKRFEMRILISTYIMSRLYFIIYSIIIQHFPFTIFLP